MFVDIHSHILYGIDDGAVDAATAIEMLRLAAEDGTTHIAATPHFISGYKSNTKVKKICGELQQMASDQGINIHIFPGNEVFISPDIPALYDNGDITAINNSSYLLVEFPAMNIPIYTNNVFYNLQLRELVPIIAHPERNREIAEKPEILQEFVNRGILLQVNSGSITGLYGRKIQKIALKLIKAGLVHFVASDAHTCESRSPKLNSAAKIVEKEFGKDLVEKLFYRNGMTVLENGQIK